MYIACARSVSENVGLPVALKNSYVVSDNFDLVLFLGYAFVVRGHAIGTQKRGVWTPPLNPPMAMIIFGLLLVSWSLVFLNHFSCSSLFSF